MKKHHHQDFVPADTAFLFAVVNPGSENALKAEVAHKYPYLRPAYSRPGFVTFKNTSDSLKVSSRLNLDLTFARVYGPCFGRFKASEIEAGIAALPAGLKVHRYSADGSAAEGPLAEVGDDVLDVIKLSLDEFWLGTHPHKRFRWPQAGANPRLVKPEVAPSRAWLKFEEALLWTGLDQPTDSVAVELGAAPGGACYGLLQHGYRVWGVDVARLSPVCTDHPHFKHVALQMHRLQSQDLPPAIDLWLCDVNLAPSEVLPQLKRLCQLRPQTGHLFYTLKIGDKTSWLEIEQALAAVKAIGFDLIRTTQLPSNHSEIFVYAARR